MSLLGPVVEPGPRRRPAEPQIVGSNPTRPATDSPAIFRMFNTCKTTDSNPKQLKSEPRYSREETLRSLPRRTLFDRKLKPSIEVQLLVMNNDPTMTQYAEF